jgi:hypothetical protein
MWSELITLLLFVFGFFSRNICYSRARCDSSNGDSRSDQRGLFDKFPSVFIEITFYLFHQVLLPVSGACITNSYIQVCIEKYSFSKAINADPKRPTAL